MSRPRIAVIGAGVSGLAAARLLRGTSELTVYEKSKRLGGRCATLQWRGARVDHGASYFSLENARIRDFVKNALPAEELRTLASDAVLHNGEVELPSSAHRRYYCVSGNNFLGTALAAKIDVKHQCTVKSITSQGMLIYETQDGENVKAEEFDAVLCTAPLPQTGVLLGSDGWVDAFRPNLTAVFEYDIPSTDHAFSRAGVYGVVLDKNGETVAWSCCENVKENRVDASRTVILAQASDAFSRKYCDVDATMWTALLQKHVESVWGLDSKDLVDAFAKRWRYARVDRRDGNAPKRRFKKKMVGNTPVYITGDGFADKSCVEDAIKLGMEVAESIADEFDTNPSR